MRIKEIILNDIKKFEKQNIFDFSGSDLINTISGKNGAGKSTIIEAILIVQKAHFAKLKGENSIEYKVFSKELYNFINSRNSTISLKITFDKTDFEDVDSKIDADRDILLLLKVASIDDTNQDVKWDISCDVPDELALFWNLNSPQKIITYLNTNNSIEEKDVNLENLHLKMVPQNDIIFEFIFTPENNFKSLYTMLITSYLYEKIVPVNRGGDAPRKDIHYYFAKYLFDEVFDNIQFAQFYGNRTPGQYILTAKKLISTNMNGTKKFSKTYDIRNFSSGEKLVWYILLCITYQKKLGILLIDEPENNLHDELLVKLYKLFENMSDIERLKNIVFKKEVLTTFNDEFEKAYKNFKLNQIFLITHSKTLIYLNLKNGANYLLDNELNLLDKGNVEAELRSIGISLIHKRVLFVEGKTELNLFTEIFSKYNILVQELNNCTEVIETYKVVDRLKEHLNSPVFVFLIDRDTRNNTELLDILDRTASNFLMLEKHEIENYYLDIDILVKYMNDNKMDNTDVFNREYIYEIVKQKAEELKIETKKKYMNEKIYKSLESMKRYVNKKNIEVDNEEKFSAYVDSLLKNEVINELKSSIIEDFRNMEIVYTTEWEDNDNWLNLMDGKGVYGKVISELSKKIGFNHIRFNEEFKQLILDCPNSELNQFIAKILEEFNVQ